MLNRIFLIGLVILYFVSWVSTGVREENVTLKKYEFKLNPGERIIVVNTVIATKVYTSIAPSEARVFDFKVPEGKRLEGILTLR